VGGQGLSDMSQNDMFAVVSVGWCLPFMPAQCVFDYKVKFSGETGWTYEVLQ